MCDVLVFLLVLEAKAGVQSCCLDVDIIQRRGRLVLFLCVSLDLQTLCLKSGFNVKVSEIRKKQIAKAFGLLPPDSEEPQL